MTTRSVKLGDNICNRITDTWYLPQAILRNNVFKRFRESEKVLRGARVRSRPVGIATTKGGSLPKFMEELSDVSGIQRTHSYTINAPRPIKCQTTNGAQN
jgi:hypothetical protein